MKAAASRFVRKSIPQAVMVAALSMTGNALAFELDFDNGWKGSLNTKMGVSAAWRAESPDKSQIGGNPTEMAAMNGGSPDQYMGNNRGFTTQAGNMNYDKGDMTTAAVKFLTEMNLSKGDTAVMVRAKGWYDYALNDRDVNWGNLPAWTDAGLRPTTTVSTPSAIPMNRWNKPLSDKGATPLQKFDGIYLLDAFVSQSFDLGELPAQVRLGRQVVNWGEGLFTRGISQLAPIDIPAARRPGTELKEVLLPTWMAVANIGLPEGRSLEAFYQLKWEASVNDYCGTFFNPGHNAANSAPGGCNLYDQTGATNGSLAQFSTTTAPIYSTKGKDPSDAGAWGVQFRFPVESIDTEFGLYAMNISANTPVVVGSGTVALSDASQIDTNAKGQAIGSPTAAAARAYVAGRVIDAATATTRFDYLENVKVFGISAATTLWGASVGAELSHHKDVPVNYYGNDLNGYLGILTPGQQTATATALREQAKRELGQYAVGQAVSFNAFERHDKTHLIINAVNSIGSIAKLLGATNGNFAGEVGFEWNDIPDYKKPGAVRFGRSAGGGGSRYLDSNGVERAAANGNCLSAVATPDAGGIGAGQFTPGRAEQWCGNDGFVTDFSWGYRLRSSLTYSQAFGTSWSMTPSIAFTHDVKGTSMDFQYQEDRMALGLGLEFDLNKEHTLNFGYTQNSGKWNPFADRDLYTFAYNYSF